MLIFADDYSTSAVDKVISSCFLELHNIAPPSKRKVYPEIACVTAADQHSTSDAKREVPEIPEITENPKVPIVGL